MFLGLSGVWGAVGLQDGRMGKLRGGGGGAEFSVYGVY